MEYCFLSAKNQASEVTHIYAIRFCGGTRIRTETPEWLPITGSFQDYCLNAIRLIPPYIKKKIQIDRFNTINDRTDSC